MAGHKITNKNIILWLLGLTICYQIVYQAFMHHELEQESLEEECRVPSVGAAFAGGQSPHCAEVQLFRSWEKTETEWHAALAAETEDDSHLIKDSAPVTHFGELTEEEAQAQAAGGNASENSEANATGNATNSTKQQDSMHKSIAAIMEATAAATAAAAAGSTTQAPSKMPKTSSGFLAPTANITEDLAANASQGNWSPVTTWAEGLENLQHRLEEHMEHLPSMHHTHAHERQAHLDSLMDNVAASLTNASKSSNHMTPWAAGLMDLQKHLDEEMKHRDEAHHHHHHHHESAPAPTTTEMSLLERIYRVGHELCDTPDHKDRPECAQFMKEKEAKQDKNAEREARRAAKASWRANLTEELKLREERLDDKLEELRHERKVWEDAFIAKIAHNTEQSTGSEVSTSEPPRVSSLRGHTYVHWSSVKAWHGPKWWEKDAGPALVSKEEVQGAHWGGMIPKVACITAITSGYHSKVQMKYFINNFHLQSYEGPRQLIFVYHHTDKEAARLVQKYADGVSIRGVAARNDEPFPSTTGLRYGAWITDADVIARWDFEEWHHPNRLSLQVRALALSTRPACLVKPHVGATLSREASLVGEAIWMRRHWRPLQANESELLDGIQASRVVNLKADDLRHEGHGSSSTKKPAACENAATMLVQAQAADGGLEERIGAKVGAQMQEMYSGLAAKRKDAAQKLRSLCVEYGAESDAARQERLSTDAEKMAAILGELDKHFKALGSLFGSSP